MFEMVPDRNHVISSLSALVGASHVIADEAMMAPYLTDWRKRYTGRALCVVRPATTDEVVAIMRFAKEHALAIVPQGGNTGLVGGSVPIGRGDEILLSLQRMNRIRAIDANSDTVIVEAGATLSVLQDKADEVGRLFPLSLASEGSATVGGAIATNAGGTAALTYGTMRDLVRAALRMRPDRIVVGEVRGGEALDTLQAMNTGHEGSMATVHANTARDALMRVENMVSMGSSAMSSRVARQQIASALHVVIQVQRLSDGSRRLTHVSEVMSHSVTPIYRKTYRKIYIVRYEVKA